MQRTAQRSNRRVFLCQFFTNWHPVASISDIFAHFWNFGKNLDITSRRHAVSATDGNRLSECSFESVSGHGSSSTAAFSALLITIKPSAPPILTSSPNLFSNAAFRACSKDLNERHTVECEKVSKLNFFRVASAAPRCPISGLEL